jgi:hypothetical protein
MPTLHPRFWTFCLMPASSVSEESVPSVFSEIVTRLQGNRLAIQVSA